MYATLSYFRGFNDHDGYEKWENQLEDFFRYFSLTPAQKCHNAQMNLAGEAYWQWKDSHIDCLKIDLSYKSFFVFGMLHTSRGHNSTI